MNIVIARVIGNNFGNRTGEQHPADLMDKALEADMSLREEHGIQQLVATNRIIDPVRLATFQSQIENGFRASACTDFVHLDIEFDPKHFAKRGTPEERALYVTNVNGARNECIEYAFENMRADYVLVMDYRCFLTESDIEELKANLVTQPEFAYYMCPQAVVTSGEDVGLNSMQCWWRGWDESRSMNVDELRPYYIVFGKTALDGPLYNENIMYGKGTRTELLATIGASGPWLQTHKTVRACPDFLTYGRGTNVRVMETMRQELDHDRVKLRQFHQEALEDVENECAELSAGLDNS